MADRPEHAGQSILEMFWDKMDEKYAALMEVMDRSPDSDLLEIEVAKMACLSMAWAIAVMQNPYAPDLDEVRAEARERWEEAEEGD